MKNKKITILGSGSWGTAVATLLAHNGHKVKLWCFEQTVHDDIAKYCVNKKYFPDVSLSKNITPTLSLQEALEHSHIIFQAVPVAFLRKTLESAKPYITKDHTWVSLSKGIENDTLLFPSQVIEDVIGFLPKISVFSGPNFALQLAHQEPTATTIASQDKEMAKALAEICASSYLLPYLSSDMLGTQVCAALKNVISLFIGMLLGAGYKENTIAFFLTVGFGEIITLLTHYNGCEQTAHGLAGLGDLMLGLIGKKNRNCSAGVLFGQGKNLQDLASILDCVPEGINTTKSIQQIIKKNNLNLPVCSATYKIIFEGLSVQDFVKEFMGS